MIYSDGSPQFENDDYTVNGTGPYTITFLYSDPVAKARSIYNE
jgi:hypothetical protein